MRKSIVSKIALCSVMTMIALCSLNAKATDGYQTYQFLCQDHAKKVQSIYSYPVILSDTLTFDNSYYGRENLRLALGAELTATVESYQFVGLPEGWKFIGENPKGKITQLIKLTETFRENGACAGVLNKNPRKCRQSEYAVVFHMTWGHIKENVYPNPKSMPVESQLSLICVEKENL